MKLLLNLLAASSTFWLLAGAAHAQNSAPMDTWVSDSGLVSRASAKKARKWPRSRWEDRDSFVDSGSTPKGNTDFDVASVEADRAKKAARLSQAERERNALIGPGSRNCVLKSVMTDAEIAACRVN